MSAPVRYVARGRDKLSIAMSAPVRYVARDEDKLSIAPITLEKGKITLLPFSLYSGELHAERVKPPRVYKP